MKRISLVFLGLGALAVPLFASENPSGTHAPPAPATHSLLLPEEQSLVFNPAFLRTDDHGHGYLQYRSESIGRDLIRSLSPWDLMELVQILAGVEIPLRRFGSGDELTAAWRDKVAMFVAQADVHVPNHPEDPFDPALVLWDPGYIQTKNEWGQWTIRIANRFIVQSDLASLSALEVQQAVEVLTGRTYPIEYVLDHLEQFRAQLSIVPRTAEAEPSSDHH